MIGVGGMVVVSCVHAARGAGGPIRGATSVGVAAIGVALVPRGVCGDARRGVVVEGVTGWRVGVAVADVAGSVVQASPLGSDPGIV